MTKGKQMGKDVKEVWSSSVDTEMTNGLTKSEIKQLVKELDDAVMEICLSHGVM